MNLAKPEMIICFYADLKGTRWKTLYNEINFWGVHVDPMHINYATSSEIVFAVDILLFRIWLVTEYLFAEKTLWTKRNRLLENLLVLSSKLLFDLRYSLARSINHIIVNGRQLFGALSEDFSVSRTNFNKDAVKAGTARRVLGGLFPKSYTLEGCILESSKSVG